MKVLRNKGFSLAALGLLTGVSVTAAQGCGEGGICGPCGTIATGQLSISGDARLDGFFKAVADFQGVIGSLKGNFDANFVAIAEAWGVVEAGADVTVDGAFVSMVIGEIRTELNGSIQGGISVEYQPPACSASVAVSVDAQASCEANAGCECEVDVDPGELSVACEGTCSGSCSGSCEGEVSCQVSGGIDCSGFTCEGTCDLSVMGGASCDGTCNGTCNGECSLQNSDGSCAGECDGMCEGSCELRAGGSGECGGTCHGECKGELPEGMCEGEVKCEGSCSGECGGSCEGNFEPPSASAECECEASADCNAQASAQAEASIECTPPSFDLVIELNAALQADASARAEFLAKLDVLKVRGAAILQGAAQIRALIDGDVNGDGELEFDPPPLANLTAEVQAVAEAGLSGDFDIPPGRIDCVIPAFQEALSALGDIGATGSATLSVHLDFFAFATNPAG